MRRRQELAELRPRQQPLLHQHLDPRGRDQVAELVVLPFGEDQVHFLQRVQHRERVRLDRRVVVLLEERRAQAEQVVERLEELRARVGRAHALDRAAVEPQAVVVVVLVVAADDAQAMLFILDVSPQQVVERAQRIDLQVRERVLRGAAADVLEAPGDRVRGLHQHPFFVPVRPDQLEQARVGELLLQDAVALARLLRRELEPSDVDVDVAELPADHGEVRQRQRAERSAGEPVRYSVVKSALRPLVGNGTSRRAK